MRRLPPAFALLLLIVACSRDGGRSERAGAAQPVPKPLEAKPASAPVAAPVVRDLEQIAEEQVLRVLFTFNSTGYFVYRGETMGYEYELLSRFARESGLRLQPLVVRDSKLLFERLNRGGADIVAAQLVAAPDEDEVLMTDTLYSTAPVVVQRGPGGPAKGQSGTVRRATEREAREAEAAPIMVQARLVSRPGELAGTAVHLTRVSPYRRRLLELNTELADDIEVVEVDETTDKLISRLAEGGIDYTVAAENVAALRTGEYSNLIIKPAIGPPQPIVWGVRKTSPRLHQVLNQWIASERQSGRLEILYRKYFLDRRGYNRRAASPHMASETGRLSEYDDAFQSGARIPVWDWRLIAAQAYQESRFDPKARSWAGAVGLMQIMPRTARELKVNPLDPRASVTAACQYLRRLERSWQSRVVDRAERIKFALASYNVGLGHVQDAVRLAEKNGDYWLIRKSKREVYNDPVVQFGFARGTEPVNYVDNILSRWDHYRETVSAAPQLEATPTPAPSPSPTASPTFPLPLPATPTPPG
jgi:membrane-bound lytic murein transglycosylase F